MSFMIINIERFAANFFTSSFILQIVKFLVLLFWNLCVFDKLWHYFLNLKGHLKLIKNYNHYCCWYQCYYKWPFYHYFHIVHYRWINWIKWTLITSFIFLLIVKIHTGKRKYFQLTSLLSQHKHTHTTAPSFKKYFGKWWFLNIYRFRL